MTRFLNLVMVGVLVAAAMGVYSIKYESTRQAERVAKLRRAIESERIAIATLRAEWAHLSQPERLEALAKKHLDLAPTSVEQIVKAAALPAKPSADDLIGKKLEGLGLSAPDVTGSTP
jgi:cell division protein FtsL